MLFLIHHELAVVGVGAAKCGVKDVVPALLEIATSDASLDPQKLRHLDEKSAWNARVRGRVVQDTFEVTVDDTRVLYYEFVELLFEFVRPHARGSRHLHLNGEIFKSLEQQVLEKMRFIVGLGKRGFQDWLKGEFRGLFLARILDGEDSFWASKMSEFKDPDQKFC